MSGRKGGAEQDRSVREKKLYKRDDKETREKEGNMKGKKERRWRKCRRS